MNRTVILQMVTLLILISGATFATLTVYPFTPETSGDHATISFTIPDGKAGSLEDHHETWTWSDNDIDRQTIPEANGGANLTFIDIPLTDVHSVYDLTNKAGNISGLDLGWVEYPGLGSFLERVDDVSSDENQGDYWIMYVDGVYSNLGASIMGISEGEHIVWVYGE